MSQLAPSRQALAIILGGTGWLGKHVCATFHRHGYHVLVVARNPRAAVAAHAFRSLDLASATAVEVAELLRVNRPDVVVNATDAMNETDGWQRTEAELVRANIRLVETLITALGRTPGRTRLVHIGTIHEFGPVPQGTLIDETTTPVAGTSYAHSRLAGTETVLRASGAGEMNAVALRLVNLCGPHPSPESFPGKILQRLREADTSNEQVNVPVADAERDFVDVRDAAEAVRLASTAPTVGRAINIGRGVPVQPWELVQLLVEVSGLPADTVRRHEGTMPSLGGAWTRADIRLAQRLLGWHPQIGMRSSLRDMWESSDD